MGGDGVVVRSIVVLSILLVDVLLIDLSDFLTDCTVVLVIVWHVCVICYTILNIFFCANGRFELNCLLLKVIV